jgi:uncharacterized protein YbjT (DUF2867 family)
MFVVSGATGRTGKVVANALLAQRRAVRAVVTDAANGQALKDQGAEVTVADVEDRAALERVFSGAEGAYVLLPPALSSIQTGLATHQFVAAEASASSTKSSGIGLQRFGYLPEFFWHPAAGVLLLARLSFQDQIRLNSKTRNRVANVVDKPTRSEGTET